jgi:SAM-dependent methyltransferase
VSELRLGRRFARLATNAVLTSPSLWRLFRRPLQLQFDRLAERWDSLQSPQNLRPLEAALGAVSPSPRRALDLGAGNGRSAVAVARFFPDAEVVGVDLSPRMVEEAWRRLPDDLRERVSFRQADAADLPFGDEEFDLVSLANMIPFFDELGRVVAPGGAVALGFSRGAGTPIYVPPERLRRELGRRGFAEFAEFAVADGTALLAHKPERA